MQRFVIVLILMTGTGLSILSCQVNQAVTATPIRSNQIVCFETDLDPVAFMPDHPRMILKGSTGVQIYNLEMRKEENFIKSAATLQDGPTVALSPEDGETLAWALIDNTIQLIRIYDGKVLHALIGHTDTITKLRFSPSGDRLFSAAHDGWVRIWNKDGKQVNAFQPGNGEVLGIGVSSDGAILATIPSDGPVTLWDTKDLHKLKELGGTSGYDTSDVAFSMDGRYIAADLASGLSVWDTTQQKRLWDGINSMAFAFSPKENRIAYSDMADGNNIMLRSLDGKQQLNKLESHQGPVFALIFSPDGSLLASADGVEIHIWQVEDGKLLYIGKAVCP